MSSKKKKMHLPVLHGVALLIFVLLATSFDSFAQHNNTTTDPQITQKVRVLSRAFDDAVIIMMPPLLQPSLPKMQFL